MLITTQRTIAHQVSCSGIGLHSGLHAQITLMAAPADTGVVFRRTDILGAKGLVKADYRNVVDTKLGTTIANEFGTKISTIEHLMAAIWGCGIDNLFIDINGPEIPIMDGSSEPFIFLIECAGTEIQGKPRTAIKIIKKIEVRDQDKVVRIEPADNFSIDLSIDFDHAQIKQQRFNYNDHSGSFKSDISRARTFGFKRDIDRLHQLGLAKGGSLDNAILVDDEGIVNKEGLRYSDEFVRHKTLDFIGDTFLAGSPIIGHFTASKSGHALNNQMLHALFNDPSAWVRV